jgi:hypothetical protein
MIVFAGLMLGCVHDLEATDTAPPDTAPCDGLPEQTYFADNDGDGYGDAGEATASCEQPSGHTLDDTDCDDNDDTVHPGAEERCDPDGIDEDCDGEANEDCLWGSVSASAADAIWIGAESGARLSGGIGGDLDGDGRSELLLRSTTHDNSTGAIWLINGTDALDGGTASSATVFYGESSGDQFATVGAIADLTGDAHADLLLTTRRYGQSGSQYTGVAYMMAGPFAEGAHNASDADWKVNPSSYISFGTDSGLAGFFNGDGYPDVIVSAEHTGTNHGSAYVFAGPLDEVTNGSEGDYWLRVTGETEQDNLGHRVNLRPVDVSGDGLDDLIIGATNHDPGGVLAAGAAYVVLGPSSGVLSASDAWRKLTGSETDEKIASSVMGAGDVDGDGLDDLLIGAAGYDCDGHADSGALFLLTADELSGATAGAHLSTTAQTKLCGAADNDALSTAAPPGDINGDGAPDLAVNGAGGLSVFYSWHDLSGTVSLDEAHALLEGDPAGSSVSSPALADYNGDGVDDLLTQQSDWGGASEEEGAVRIFLGLP